MSIIGTHSFIYTFSFDSLPSFLSPETHKDIIHKEYDLNEQGSLIIDNIHGNIYVKTEWKRKTIFLKVVKQTKKKEQLTNIQILDNESTNNAIKIKTVYTDESIKGFVDYFLIIPANMALQLTTGGKGNIKVKRVNGSVSATTDHGDIETYYTNNTVIAQSNTGSINIYQANGPVKAVSTKGPITIHDAKDSIIATTKNNRITAQCKELPATSKISLETTKDIMLSLPRDINADLQAQTTHGTLICDHYVTLKPQTTKLNSQTWTRFKREVDGLLGSGEARITLNSTNGNIKILETKTS